MKPWKLCVGSVVGLLSITGGVAAQLPGAGAGTAPPPGASAATTAVTQATSGNRTLWDFLGCSWENKRRCLEWFCQCPLGGLVNNMLRPMSAFTGGMIGPICPTVPTDEALRKLQEDPAKKGGPEDLAAQVKQAEAEAKARAAAVRYLATVDCSRFEGVDDALIKALLFDPSECVRWEAAKALQTGCCCNKKTIDALAIVAAGQGGKVKMGGEERIVPVEKCARVREAAAIALERCVACFRETSSETAPDRRPDAPPVPTPAPDRPPTALGQRSMNETLKDAEEALKVRRTAALPPSGSRGVFDLVNASVKSHQPASTPTAAVVAAQPVQPTQTVRLVPVPQAAAYATQHRPQSIPNDTVVLPSTVGTQQARFMQPSPQYVQPIYPAQVTTSAPAPKVQVVFDDQPQSTPTVGVPSASSAPVVVAAPDNSISGKLKNMLRPTTRSTEPGLDQRMFNLLNQSSGSTGSGGGKK